MTHAMAIQCLPLSISSKKDAYALVDEAIRIADGSGLAYTVGPFETVVEGPVERLFQLAEQMHRAILEAGGAKGGVATYIKMFSGEEMGSTEEKIGKYRNRGH